MKKSNSFLLDTNVIIALLQGDLNIADKVDSARSIYIPITVIGELYYGVMYTNKTDKYVADINKFINNYTVLHIDDSIAMVYGNIKAALKKKGKHIPENDIWIAAIAEHHDLCLISKDKNFREIDSLLVRNWH
jgi:tRNA(fMet)-specific endonuclease VapC